MKVDFHHTICSERVDKVDLLQNIKLTHHLSSLNKPTVKGSLAHFVNQEKYTSSDKIGTGEYPFFFVSASSKNLSRLGIVV